MSWKEKRKHFELAFRDIFSTQEYFRNPYGDTNLKDTAESIMNTSINVNIAAKESNTNSVNSNYDERIRG